MNLFDAYDYPGRSLPKGADGEGFQREVARRRAAAEAARKLRAEQAARFAADEKMRAGSPAADYDPSAAPMSGLETAAGMLPMGQSIFDLATKGSVEPGTLALDAGLTALPFGRVPGVRKALAVGAGAAAMSPDDAEAGGLFAQGRKLLPGAWAGRQGEFAMSDLKKALHADQLKAAETGMLDERSGDKLLGMFQRAPELEKLAPYMTGPELASISRLRNDASVDKVKQLIDVLPAAEAGATAMKVGQDAAPWYRASTQALIDTFGDDAPRFAALLAATSPQQSVQANLGNALQIWNAWKAAGEPKGALAINNIMNSALGGKSSVLKAWRDNSVHALSAADSRAALKTTLSGAKADSFMRNLGDDVLAFTADAHEFDRSGVNLFNMLESEVGRPQITTGGKVEGKLAERRRQLGDPGVKPAYAIAAARGRQSGELVGLAPSEAQAAGWVTTKGLKSEVDDAGAMKSSARERLERGDFETPRVGFADMMANPEARAHSGAPTFHELLDRGGYAPPTVKPGPRSNVTLSLPEQRHLWDLAAMLDRLNGFDSARKMRPTSKRPLSMFDASQDIPF